MASRGVNKCIIVGNLGNDPEVNYPQGGGNPVTKISVATSEQWTDKNTQQKQERTEWHRVVFFGRLAEIAGEYLRKGSKVYIEGSLRTTKYTDKAGVEKYSTDIIASEMQMLDSRGDGVQTGQQQPQQMQQMQQQAPQHQPMQQQAPQQGFQQQQVQQQAPMQQQRQQAQQNTMNQQQGGNIPSQDFNDDVPF